MRAVCGHGVCRTNETKEDERMRRVLAILLALTMMLSLTVSAAWADDPDPTPGTPAGTEEPADPGSTPTNPDGETPTTPGNETPATPGGETPAAPAGKTIKIIYTNDVHTYIDNDKAKDKDGNLKTNALTYAHVAALKKDLEGAGNDVLLVDAGDHIQGTAYGGMDQGAAIMSLMSAAGYNVATLGNHEFDYGMERALAVSDSENNGGIPYVSCNFYRVNADGTRGDLVLSPYMVRTLSNGVKVAFVGITTPESFTKSTPKYFQDDNGNYIYGISGGADGQALYADVQAAIDNAKAAGADYVIALGHLGVDPSSNPWTSKEVIANTTGLAAFIDGHSHTKMAKELVKDKDGKDVVLTQTGSYLKNVGVLTIDADGNIDTELLSEYNNVNTTVKAMQDNWIGQVDGKLGEVIAESEITFTDKDANGDRAVRKQATNMGDLNADAYYWYINNEYKSVGCDVAIMNGGGIRSGAAAGKWTYKTCKTINTFGNVLCAMKVTGQQILDALEWGARVTPDAENGGFLHVAGLTYKINTAIKSTVQMDEKNVWTGGPTGQYRVYDVKVFNKATGAYEALVLDKIYTLGGSNYTLRNLGDGFAMFAGATLVLDGLCEDYLAMAAYVKSFADTNNNQLPDIASANSPLKALKGYLLNYENAAGSGRITLTSGFDNITPPTGGGGKRPAPSKTVSSAKTADAGVVIYAGMMLVSMAGTGAVLGKKKEF